MTKTGSTLVNHWQRGVPVYREPVVTPTLLFFAALAAVGLVLAGLRFFSPLGPFSGMNDAYAWGIWKTFNVMTLTALGSGPLAVGIAAWVFNRHKLHVVMRTALVSGFLFLLYGTSRSRIRRRSPLEFLQRIAALAMECRVGDARDFHMHAALLRRVPLV
jgi:hypothetical protein